MPGTKAGGIKLRQTMIAKYGSLEAWREHMRGIGTEGGSTPTLFKNERGNDLKGFAVNPALASKVGKIGGRISRRYNQRSQVATATDHETRI